MPDRPCALYRFYDAAGELLYVGISLELPARWDAHDSLTPWWTQVAYARIEHFPSKALASAAERAAVRAEHPVWNKHYNQRGTDMARTPKHSIPVEDALWDAALEKCARIQRPEISNSAICRQGLVDFIKESDEESIKRLGNPS